MLKSPNKKILIVSLISFIVILLTFSALFFFDIISLPGNTSTAETQNDFDRYISEEDQDALADEIDTEEVVPDSNTINDDKAGELETDNTRQVLNTTDELTTAEKQAYEEAYGVEFIEEDSENGVYVIGIDDDSDLDGLQEEDGVEHIETDTPVKMFADTVDWGISRIGANNIWAETTGSGVKIAIIDTGIQTDHPDLSANLVVGYDFVNDDSNAYDDNGHGTHVAGIVAATLNQAGTVGASYNARLMPIKVLNSDGYGYLSDVAEGIYFAANNGARVINLSLGAPTDSYTLQTAVNYAAKKGVLVVAAAGNDYGSPCSYPAAYSSAICVVATDKDNKLASFSNVGGELAAPGVSNYSTFLGSTYRYLSGTSMATPHVSGSAAALMALCTTCTTSEIRTLLRETAVDLGAEGTDIIFGYGLVDLAAAVHSITDEDTEDVPGEDPVADDPDDTDTPEVVAPTKGYDKQSIKITLPETSNNRRYIHKTNEDIVLEFELSPLSDNSGLSKTEITIDNDLVYTTDKQEDSYTIPVESLDHSQHWVRAISYFKDNSRSQTSIVIDMTYLEISSDSLRGKRSRDVLGISTSIFDSIWSFFNF